MFTHLHVHTEYSALDGMCKVPEYVAHMAKLGHTALAVTDHGNINGAVNFSEECERNGVKPIIGCEFYVTKDIEIHDKWAMHLIVLAKNKKGYINLCKLTSIANIQGFYYKPKIDLKSLIAHKDGLIILSACTAGVVNKPFLSGDLELAYKNFFDLKAAFGEDFYLEIIPIDFPDQITVNKFMLSLSEGHGVKLVATNDAHYIHEGDSKYQEMIVCIGEKKKMRDNDRFKFTVLSLFLADRAEMIKMFAKNHPELPIVKVEEAIDEAKKIADKCEVYSLKGYNIFPKVDFLKGEYADTKAHLLVLLDKAMIKKGFKGKPEYEQRLAEELEQIFEKGFTDYFILVWDLIRWAREQDILVGPGRGSSAGSFVCYLLGVTNVDPLKYGTMFFRFIDPNRNDLPDIDIDFEDYRREEVKQYLIGLYGRENVANIGTFGKLKGKLVIKDLARIYDIPPFEIAAITRYILERSSADARASFTVEDAFNQFEVCKKFKEKYPHIVEAASRLEGQCKQFGISAAGVIVADRPVSEYCPIELRGKDKVQCVGFDFRNIGYMGLLKMDLLGINFLTIIKKTVDQLKAQGIIVDLENLDFQDPAIFKMIAEEHCVGIFQFETPVMNKIAKAIHIDNFDELTACNALVRPGPFRSGSTQSYVAKKQGKLPITYKNAILKEITEETKGELLYQEQIMNLVRRMGNFSWKDTNLVRKAMSKSQGVELMRKYMELFIAGAKENGIERLQAQKIWEETSYYGAWSFNKSHAVAYTMLSYWCAWLKYYHPKEYLTAFVNFNTNENRIFEGVRHIKELGYDLKAPRHNLASEKMIIVDKAAYIGLTHVKGFGDAVIAEIVKAKDAKDLDEWIEIVTKRIINSKIKKILVNTGFFEDWGTIPELNEYFNLKYTDEDPATPEDWMYDRCSLLFCDNILKKYDRFLVANTNQDMVWNTLSETDASDESEVKGDWVLLKGLLNGINLKNKSLIAKGKDSAHGRQDIDSGEENRYCVSDFFDGTGYLRVSFFPEVYKKYESQIWASKNNAPVIIRGTIGPDRIYVKEFINIKTWQSGDEKMFDAKFAEKLMRGIKTQEQIDEVVATIVDKIDQPIEVEVASIREHVTKKGMGMAFVSLALNEDVKLETVVWSDAFARWKNFFKKGNMLNVRFSSYKEGKFYLDCLHGKVSSLDGSIEEVQKTEDAGTPAVIAYAPTQDAGWDLW